MKWMSHSLGVNPWSSMWTKPRKTIRSIVDTNPKYGFFLLATIYALQELLFFASFYSLGLAHHFVTVLIIAIVLSPILGAIMLYFISWVFYFTGRWLGGKAPYLHIRATVSWSKIPYLINILMWFILVVFSAEYIFIHYAKGPSLFFINLITLITLIWSLVLFIQGLREVQNFSVGRTIGNIILAYFITFLITFVLAFVWGFAINLVR